MVTQTPAAAQNKGTARKRVQSPNTQQHTVVTGNASGYLIVQNGKTTLQSTSTGKYIVPAHLVKKYDLRYGDKVTVSLLGNASIQDILQLNEQKVIPIKRIDFDKLIPIYPQVILKMETTPTELTGRMLDLVAPIGKGQRCLIVSPPKAGKTMVLQAIAKALGANNPECKVLILLVDERPEEVTDWVRSVPGEVIASTFDRPSREHIAAAELAMERAKRLVEEGQDVVLLLDSITRLGRAYNLAAPGNGKILSGGVDSTALYPPKRLFGCARNIENGGSLTIVATALVETGSKMDEVIFEEFKGTGNSEIKLDRNLSDKRIFPAIDINNSSTRKEELLRNVEAFRVVSSLRHILSGLDTITAAELLLGKLRDTTKNNEFLTQVANSSPRVH